MHLAEAEEWNTISRQCRRRARLVHLCARVVSWQSRLDAHVRPTVAAAAAPTSSPSSPLGPRGGGALLPLPAAFSGLA